MKTVSLDLFNLVKSLSKQEKRYFKLYASRHIIGEQNNYVLLFDAIDKQSAYNEEKIKKKFEGETFVKQLHVAKNYLYKLILSALRQYQANTKEDDFYNQMKNVQILFDKGLYKQSEKIANRIKKSAVENERFLQVLEIYNWEHTTIHVHNNFKKLDHYINVDFQEVMANLEKYQNYLDFQLLIDQIFVPYWKKGSIRNEKDKQVLSQLFEKDLYKSAENAKSFNARYFYHNARFTYHYLIGELEMCLTHTEEQVKMFEDLNFKEIQIKGVARYVSALINLYLVQKDLGQYQEAILSLQKIREIPTKTKVQKARFFIRSFNLEIDFYISTGRFSEGVKNILPSLETFKEYYNLIEKTQRINAFYNLAYLFFGAKQFDSSQDWINELLNDPELKTREDIHSFGRLLNLFIHFELGNDQLLEHIVKSTSRFLSNRKILYKVETIILSFIKKYPSWISKKDIVSGFKDLRTELQTLTKDEYENRAFAYFDFLAWLDSKIEGVEFEQVVQGKHLS